MDRDRVVEILNEIGTLLELKGENPFKTRAYSNAARTLESLSEPLEKLIAENRLAEIKGIGDGIQKKITELVTTGKLPFYEDLKARTPPGLVEMLRIPGLGPKKVMALHGQLGIDSLEKLRSDAVDLLQLHNATVADVEKGGLVEVLREIKAAGKARWIGASSVSPHLETFIEWGVFDVFQVPYSALERTHERLLQKAHDVGAGTIVRGGVARGEPGVGRGAEDRWRLWTAARLDELLGEGESRTEWMLRFTLSHPGVDTVIVGTLQPEHLEQNLRALQAGPLPADVYAEAKRRLDAAAG